MDEKITDQWKNKSKSFSWRERLFQKVCLRSMNIEQNKDEYRKNKVKTSRQKATGHLRESEMSRNIQGKIKIRMTRKG